MADTTTSQPTNESSEDLAYDYEELIDWPKDQLEKLDPQRLEATSDYALGQFLERLEIDEARDLLRQLSTERVSGILSEMVDTEWAAEILAAIRDHRASQILDSFSPDDAADIVAELDDEDRERLLERLPSDQRQTLVNLLTYDPESAGGIMTTQVDTALDDMTIDEAIGRIREIANHHEDLHYVYVVDREGRLKGIISLRKLIQAKPMQRIRDVMRTDIRGVVPPELDQEEVAQVMAELNLADVAVVDSEGRLLGIITHDDILDVIQEEATEDIQKLAGAGGDESLTDDVLFSVRRRQPWLGVNLMTAFLSAAVVLFFEKEISALPVLAGLMPIIAGVGGNSGQQALAVAIRSIALGHLQPGEGRLVVLKQIAIGLINGIVIGGLAGAIVYVFEQDLTLSLVVLAAMVLNMVIAGVAGAFVPLFLKKINRDPAQSSSILLTAITDTGGFFIFLSLGAWLLL
jgi:magnesium transporter